MDFLTGKIRLMYFQYLAAAFGGALISSIYGVVDMAMVGRYQGPGGTAAVFGLIWTALAEAVPNLFIRIFMAPTEGILAIAPKIIRAYGLPFLLLPFNIFSTYYFQALMKPTASFLVSVGRGTVISGVLIYLLSAVAGADAIWFAMPLTELIVAAAVATAMLRYAGQLSADTKP